MADILSHYFGLISLAVNLLLAAAAWILARTVVSRGDFDALKGRVALVEAQIEKLPGWTLMNSIKEDIGGLRTVLATLNATLAGHVEQARYMRESITRMETYLLEREKNVP